MGWVNHVRRWLRFPVNIISNRLTPPILVLLYHRVCQIHHDPQKLCVSPHRFRAQLDWIRRRYPVVAFDADWSTVNEPAVSITFDDGYADNYLHALPVLEELNIPATFFVATGTLGTLREFWWDQLDHLLLPRTRAPEVLDIQYAEVKRRWPTATSKQRLLAYRELHCLLRSLDATQREQILINLRVWANSPADGRPTHRTLSLEELIKLASSSCAVIGAHTVTHSVLSQLPTNRQWEEIIQSRDQLHDLTGKPVDVFAYPFGARRDYNRNSVSICRELGFLRCAANVPGQYRPWTDPMQVPRQIVRNLDAKQFARWMRWAWTRCD